MKVLCVDNLKDHQQGMKDSVSKLGHKAHCCNGAAAKALTAEQALTYDVALLDQNLEDNITGEEVGRALRSKNPHIFLMMLTAYGSVERAVQAMQVDGFNSYLTKPSNEELLRKAMLSAEKAVGFLRLTDAELFQQIRSKGIPLIGAHDAFVAVVKKAMTVASSTAGVLLLGESGTGKELFAKIIHKFSDKHAQPLVSINCPAIPETLLESELFGHEKGAFTGALARKTGRVEAADNGTLFLDEIADMSSPLQAKMLRFLQDGSFNRVGGTTELRVTVRLIAATNANLLDKITKSEFREDLYHRLNVIQIKLPPLRERASDIPILAEHFLRKFASQQGGKPRSIESEAMTALMRHTWRGNVRALENAIREAAILAKTKDAIAVGDLRFDNSQAVATRVSGSVASFQDHSGLADPAALRRLCEEIERTGGKCIQNSSDVLLKTHGAAMLKDVLALFYVHYKEKNDQQHFDLLFGCMSAARPSVEIKHDLLRFSKDQATKAVFTPKSGTKNYGMRDLEADGKALRQRGIALSEWLPLA